MSESASLKLAPPPLWVAALVFLLALLFRGVYLAEIRHLPDFEAPLADAGYHDYIAWGMASGEWTPPLGMPDPEIRTTPYFRPPLVVFWMAGLFRVLGHDHVAARVLQILLGSLSCVLTYWLGRRLFGNACGAIAGVLASVYWMLVYFDTEYREVSFLVFLYVAMLLALLRYRDAPSARRAWPVGLTWGLAILAKPNGLLLMPILVAWMWFVARASIGPRRPALHALLMVLVAGACIAPVTLRNWIAADDPVLVSSNGGINLFIGNNPNTNGTQVSLPKEIPAFDSAYDYPRIVHWIEEREGRSLKHSEASAWFSRQAVDYIRQEPLATLRMYLRKLAAFWTAVEIVSEKDLVASRAESTLLKLVPLDFAAVFASAMLGLLLALIPRLAPSPSPATGRAVDREGVWLIAILVAFYCLSFLPFFVTARFRAPILPFLLIFSAFGAWRTALLLLARRLVAGGGCLLAMIGLYVLDHYEVPGYAYDPAKSVTERGALLALEGRAEEAEAVLRESVALNPDNSNARNNLGLFLHLNGRSAEAVVELRKALESNPQNYRAHQNLGLALTAEKQPQEALHHFRTAQRLQPLNPALPFAAAEAMLATGQVGSAKELAEQGLRLAPESVAGNMLLGAIHFAVDDLEGATPYYLRASELDPTNAKAFNRLGLCYLRSALYDQSVAAFERAVGLEPGNQRFQANLLRARQEQPKPR